MNLLLLSIDNDGQSTTYSYDSMGGNIWAKDCKGNKEMFAYNADGALLKHLDLCLQNAVVYSSSETTQIGPYQRMVTNMGARVYDPMLGRFDSPDPITQFADNMQSFTRYSYVLNSPLTFTDPTGLSIFGSIGRWFSKAFKGLGHMFSHLEHSVTNAIRHSSIVRSLLHVLLEVGLYLVPLCEWWCAALADMAQSAFMVKIEGGPWRDAFKAAAVDGAEIFAFREIGG